MTKFRANSQQTDFSKIPFRCQHFCHFILQLHMNLIFHGSQYFSPRSIYDESMYQNHLVRNVPQDRVEACLQLLIPRRRHPRPFLQHRRSLIEVLAPPTPNGVTYEAS